MGAWSRPFAVPQPWGAVEHPAAPRPYPGRSSTTGRSLVINEEPLAHVIAMPCAVPPPSLLTRALLRVYRAASPEAVRAGREWYDVAFSHCERLAAWHNRSIPEVAVALAHLSPRTPWAQNLLLLEHLLAGNSKPVWALGRSWEQAQSALTSETPTETFGRRALKTWHFARAILGDQSAVAVDTWIARAVGIPEKSVRSMGGYNAVHDAFHRGAKIERDISPRDLQAVVWVAWRGKAD